MQFSNFPWNNLSNTAIWFAGMRWKRIILLTWLKVRQFLNLWKKFICDILKRTWMANKYIQREKIHINIYCSKKRLIMLGSYTQSQKTQPPNTAIKQRRKERMCLYTKYRFIWKDTTNKRKYLNICWFTACSRRKNSAT